MIPVGKDKKLMFRQNICPLNKHSQKKQTFGKISKIQVFEADLSNYGISCNCYVKVNKISLNKGE